MAYHFVEGFEVVRHGSVLGKKWIVTTPIGVAISNTGRLHGNCFSFAGNAITTPSLGSHTTYVVGFGLKGIGGGTGTNSTYLTFLAGGTPQFTIVYLSTRILEVRRGAYNGTLLETGTTVLPNNNWAYIEVKVTLNDSGATGAYEVRINGILEMNNGGANIQTIPANPDSADQVRFSTGSSITINLDDIYILSTDGGGETDFQGDMVVEGLFPSAAGDFTDWSVTSGTNWAAVENVPTNPNYNLYIHSETPGDKDAYEFDNISFITGSVKAVQALMIGRMDTAVENRVVKAYFRNSADVEGDFPDNWTVTGTTDAGFYSILEEDPAAAAAWTLTEINAGQFGLEVVS